MANPVQRRFNYAKWGLVVAAVSAIAAVVTVPAIGCRVGLNSSACSANLRDVELVAQSDTGATLSNVKIQVFGKGAPEVQYTDNNGYAKVRIPNEGDVRVTLTKDGYPVQDLNINIANSPSTVRVIRFSESGQPDVAELESGSSGNSSETSAASGDVPTTAFVQSSRGIYFQLKGCRQENDVLTCELLVTDKQEGRQMYLYSSYNSSSTSRIIDTQGNQYVADTVEFGGESGRSYVSQNLAKDIGLKAFVIFNDQIEDEQLALVEFKAKTSDQGYFSMEFRDVPVSR